MQYKHSKKSQRKTTVGTNPYLYHLLKKVFWCSSHAGCSSLYSHLTDNKTCVSIYLDTLIVTAWLLFTHFAVMPCGCWRGTTIQHCCLHDSKTTLTAERICPPPLLTNRGTPRHTHADHHTKKCGVQSQNLRQTNITDYSRINCDQPQLLLPATSLRI